MQFKNMSEAIKFIASRAKCYPDELSYYSSEEYKQIYSELCRVNRLLQEAYTIHKM